MADEIIDYGKWKTPSGWNELTLKQFQDIERYYADKNKEFDVRDVLEVFTDHSRDEVYQLPIEFVEKLLEALKWLSEPPKYGQPINYVDIDGERYEVNVREKLKTGEYVAVNTVIKSSPHNYAALLAILCRKNGEIYDSKFENEVLPSRVEMFEKQSVVSVMPVVFFFINLWIALGQTTQLSLRVEEAINLEREHILSLRKSGDLSMFSTKSLMKKLTKLEKSIKSI